MLRVQVSEFIQSLFHVVRFDTIAVAELAAFSFTRRSPIGKYYYYIA